MTGAQSSSWPDLLPELLGLVLARLPSIVDRVCLRAVCRSWRSNAQSLLLPPPLPWLTLLDRTFLTIPDGKIIRMLENDALCCGSVDDWLFFVHHDAGCSLMNPFSKATRDLPKLDIKWFNASPSCNSYFTKLAVPSPMESAPGSLVAALILDGGSKIRLFQQSIGTCLAIESNLRRFNHLSDIAFFNGKLYGVGLHSELSIFEISYGVDSKPMISSVKCITRPAKRLAVPRDLPHGKVYMMQLRYLVECCGSLLLVIQTVEWDSVLIHDHSQGNHTLAFEVFEADWSTKPGQWRCVSKLGGQALFVGKHCSKSFPAGGCTGIEEDCIHFMCDYYPARLAIDPLRDSGVYNMRNGIITPLLSETAITLQHSGGQGRPTWIFPCYAM